MLSFFKDQLKKEGRNTRYFNREFLAIFIYAYNHGDYTRVVNTEFYQKNGGTYCRFLELFEKYKAAINHLKSLQK